MSGAAGGVREYADHREKHSDLPVAKSLDVDGRRLGAAIGVPGDDARTNATLPIAEPLPALKSTGRLHEVSGDSLSVRR